MVNVLYSNILKAFSICFLSFFLVSIIYTDESVSSPSEPSQPVIEELKIPEITMDGTNQVFSNTLFLCRVSVIFSDGSTLEGTMQLSNNIILSFTNDLTSQVSIKAIPLYRIEKITVVKWMPEQKDKGTFLFLPVEYRIYTNGDDPSYLTYTNNIVELNSFTVGDEKYGYKQLYTIFYDNWIEGKKGVSRWENSKADYFPYNTIHPISGVVTTINFIRY